MGRRRGVGASQGVVEGGCHFTYQVPAFVHGETDTMARYPFVWTTGNGQVLLGEGRRDGGERNVLQCLVQ